MKATIAAVKAIIAGVKALVAAIAAGGWVAVAVILVICLVALILGSVFGIFFSGEDSGTGMSMQSVVREINAEYDNKLAELKNGTTYILANRINRFLTAHRTAHSCRENSVRLWRDAFRQPKFRKFLEKWQKSIEIT